MLLSIKALSKCWLMVDLAGRRAQQSQCREDIQRVFCMKYTRMCFRRRVHQDALEGGEYGRVCCREESTPEFAAGKRVHQGVLQGGEYIRVCCR
jgi:hypothetical protein